MKKQLFLLPLLILLACSPVKKYESLPEVKAWDKDIRQFEQLDKTETYPPNSILFTGSSSIRLWTTLADDMKPYPVIQRGYGGSKLSDFAVYVSRIVDPHPCSAIVIFIANDISDTDKDKTPEEVLHLFRYVLKTIRKTHPSTPVFWIAVTPTPLRWKVWPQIKQANDLVKAECEKSRDTYFIRTDFAFLNDAGEPIREYFRNDKLHLNEKGYAVWSDAIRKELNKVVPVSQYN